MSYNWDREPDMDSLRRAYARLKSEPNEAIRDLEGLAARGSLASMQYIGSAYELGEGVQPDQAKAWQWYERAAHAGAPLAAYKLGRKYLREGKYTEAQKSFEIGMAQGYMPCIHFLGRMYWKGFGVSPNLDHARLLLERASSAGYVFAKRDLAIFLIQGRFGLAQRIRGVWLWLASVKGLVTVFLTDPTLEKLR
jgi:uncharacterized protein